jgi:hypothetical protein
MILSYADSHSSAGDCTRDYEIGRDTHLIGSNKSFGPEKKHVFVLLKRGNRDYLGYCGISGNRVTDKQPWADRGGATWKYIYEAPIHTDIEYLDAFCERAGVDLRIFTGAKRFGHPREADYAGWWKVIEAVKNLKA